MLTVFATNEHAGEVRVHQFMTVSPHIDDGMSIPKQCHLLLWPPDLPVPSKEQPVDCQRITLSLCIPVQGPYITMQLNRNSFRPF
ncbi:hypothetical protein Ae201684_009640 [Aphanomyces euteiches]|uniref:Uncharacterized protein n=1 Tax=Aphanomyces euteiches TaxID=100861 RepID=A0A6G0X0Q8_9STRA|nr:hypothetical protein Ae201684_009640 [Aphanomyces euteiches]